jgi:hypothetical protein
VFQLKLPTNSFFDILLSSYSGSVGAADAPQFTRWCGPVARRIAGPPRWLTGAVVSKNHAARLDFEDVLCDRGGCASVPPFR